MGVVAMRASWPASPLSAYAERGTGGEAPVALEPDEGTMVDRSSFGEVRMTDLSRVRGALWLAPAALTLAACDGTAPKASYPLSLSVTAKGTSGVSVPGSGMSAAIQIGSGANS